MPRFRKVVPIVCGLIWAGLCLGFIRPAQAHSGCNVMPFVGLVVLPEPGLKLTDRNQADFAFGKINFLDNPQVERRFTVRNESETPFAITGLETTCHCTTVSVETIADLSVTVNGLVHYLPPGQAMVVKMTVQLARQPSGPMSHGVAIRVAGQDNPVVGLHVSGEMEAAMAVSTSELDFGQMRKGETQTQELSIVCDSRLLSGGALPRLEVQSGADPTAKTNDFIKIVSRMGCSAPRENTYEITVQPKQTGAFSVRLTFASITPADYQGMIPYDRAMEVFRTVQVDVRGEVVAK